MEQSVEASYLYDVQTKRILESNEAFRRMMGYPCVSSRKPGQDGRSSTAHLR
jgi:hypothetical protein